ncbi:MAG: hypothetical protein QOF83_1889 [Solirubrobacteraceae bacterium]|jgi:hypothetical protein|nr:hypothetical protein [Solirubrobacteraceae bacterium]
MALVQKVSSAFVAQVRNVRPGYVVVHPNRQKAICKLTRLVVVLLLVASVVLMLMLTIGGWNKLQGLKPINFVWCLVYVLLAGAILFKWARGLLPIAALFAILLMIIAIVASTGLAGTSWFDRDHSGFASPDSLFGGTGLSPNVLGSITVLLIPVEIALIVFAMIGFAQGWNVEQEVPEDEARKRGLKTIAGGPEAATA